MNNLLVKKEVFLESLGKNAEVKIYNVAKTAIEKGWESLYFSDNMDTFACVEVGEYIAVLETLGDVKICSDDNEEIYDGRDTEAIAKILDEGRIDNYFISYNNWFAFSFGKIIKRYENGYASFERIEDYVYEATPKTIEEFEADMIQLAEWAYTEFVQE